MRAVEDDPVESKVAEAREHLGLGLSLEIAAAHVLVLADRSCPHEDHAGALQRIARLALVQHQGRQGSAAAFPKELLGGGLGIEIRGWLHRALQPLSKQLSASPVCPR